MESEIDKEIDSSEFKKLLHKCSTCQIYFNLEDNIPKSRKCGHAICDNCINYKETTCSNATCMNLELAATPKDWTYPINELLIEINRDYLMKEKNKYLSFKTYQDIETKITSMSVKFNSDLHYLDIKKLKNYRDIQVKLQDWYLKLDNLSPMRTSAVGTGNLGVATGRFEIVIKGIVEVMSKLLKDKDFKDRYLNTPLTNFKPDEYLGDARPLHFTSNMKEMLNALKEEENAFVGYRINGNFAWSKVRTVQSALLFGAFDTSYEPDVKATIVHFKWLKNLIIENRMVYFEFEADKSGYGHLLKTKPQFPSSFRIFIKLREGFEKHMLDLQFYYLCTGENGESYLKSSVTVKKDIVRIDDSKIRTKDLLPNIPDKKSKEWEAIPGSVCFFSTPGEYSSFYIVKTKTKMNGNYTYIGSLYSGLQFFVDNEIKSTVKDCGYVIV